METPPRLFILSMGSFPRLRLPALLPLALLFLGAPLSSQIVGGRWGERMRFNGVLQNDRYGWKVAAASDVDLDGFPDFLVGSHASTGGHLFNGACEVRSGVDGHVIHRWFGENDGDYFGRTLAGGEDLDGDGVPDVVVGAKTTDYGGVDAGSVYFFSGADGHLLLRVDGETAGDNFGFSVAFLGDLSGDGISEILVTAPRASYHGLESGSAYVLSGRDGSIRKRFDGELRRDNFGWYGNRAEDVNGDGVPDLVVGATYADPNGRVDAGAAYVYSGADSSLLWRFEGENPGDFFARCVAPGGDVDQDGCADVLVGARHADPNGTSSGVAYLYSGSTGQLLYRWEGAEAGDQLGRSVYTAGDFDLDGIPDLAVGCPGAHDYGELHVYSGADGSLLRVFRAQGRGRPLFGWSCTQGGDLNGDGYPDLITSAPGARLGSAWDVGVAVVLSLDPLLRAEPQTISSATGGSFVFHLEFGPAEGGFPYQLFFSKLGTGPSTLLGLEIPLSQDALFHASAQGSLSPSIFRDTSGVLDSEGHADALASFLPGEAASLVGQSIWAAALSFGNGSAHLPRVSSVPVELGFLP